MKKYCEMCHGEINQLESYVSTNGKDFHLVDVQEDGSKRRCFDEYEEACFQESCIQLMRREGL